MDKKIHCSFLASGAGNSLIGNSASGPKNSSSAFFWPVDQDNAKSIFLASGQKMSFMAVSVASGTWGSLIGDLASANGPKTSCSAFFWPVDQKTPSQLVLASGQKMSFMAVFVASGTGGSLIGDFASASGPKNSCSAFFWPVDQKHPLSACFGQWTKNILHGSFFGQWSMEFPNRRFCQWTKKIPLSFFWPKDQKNPLQFFGQWSREFPIGDSASGPKNSCSAFFGPVDQKHPLLACFGLSKQFGFLNLPC